MKIIKRNPFEVEPKQAMIEDVASEADLSGEPLFNHELTILATENPEVDELTEVRLRRLVSKVIQRQKESGQAEHPKSFVNAIEWAGDGEYPYVVALAEAEITESVTVDRIGRRDFAKPWVYSGCAGVIIIVLVVLAFVVWLLRRLL